MPEGRTPVKATSFHPKSLLRAMPFGAAILDTDRRIVAMNPALEELVGYREEQVRGVPCSLVLRTNLCGGGCPLDRQDTDAPPLFAEANLVNRDRRKVSVRLTVAPLEDGCGEPRGFLATVEDMTSLEEVDHELRTEFGFGPLLGRCRSMRELFDLVPIIAQTDSSVLLTGETGTGKDVLAEVLHKASPRESRPFVKVNCGALPESLLESELFGHMKGAFTGAVHDRPGRISLANRGTLYLTEIGDLPLNLQVKLLTFLDDKVIHPLGGTKGISLDVRIVAATHRNLEKMVEEGRFRQDLLYRLNVVRLHLPPVRERLEDKELLLDHFVRKFAASFGKPVPTFSRATHALLLDYAYPGNVRELRNVVEYATNLCQDGRIRRHHLPRYLLGESPSPTPRPAESRPAPGPEVGPEESWADVERRLILDALVRAKGRRARAAKILGWGRSTLWRKMKRHRIDD
jgi:two-component system response regulator AtoC